MVLASIIKVTLIAAILSNSCLFGRLRERRERANACSSVQGTSVQGTSVQGTSVQGTSVQGTSVQRQVGGIPVLDISLNWF
jgi:hypothetical protein